MLGNVVWCVSRKEEWLGGQPEFFYYDILLLCVIFLPCSINATPLSFLQPLIFLAENCLRYKKEEEEEIEDSTYIVFSIF